MRAMDGIHKGGRPEKYNDDFYRSIVQEFNSFTIGQMANNHHTTKATISRWLKKGRSMVGNEQTKSE